MRIIQKALENISWNDGLIGPISKELKIAVNAMKNKK